MQLIDRDEAVGRFSAALDRIVPGFRESDDTLCCAISGGPDSMAMLWLAARALGSDRLTVATVDHGLRAEAADEAAMVNRYCEASGIDCAVIALDGDSQDNVQAWARRARYDRIGKHAEAQGAPWIATAHHGDDQRETFLMRLARGSGVSGLASIREMNGNVIRPLLDFRREELDALCKAENVPTVADPSNEDAKYDRVRMRQWLGKNDFPVSPQAIVQSARALEEAEEMLSFTTDLFAAQCLSVGDETIRLSFDELPRELVRRLVLIALAELGEEPPRGDALMRFIEAVAAGDKAMVGNVIGTSDDKGWYFQPAPPRGMR